MKRKSGQIEILSSSAQETMVVACLIGKKLKKGDILALSGELGSGKTCFTSGLARGLEISDEYKITSPTFTLINEYPGRCKLYHFDVYRISSYSEFEDLGYEELFCGDGVAVIEWAEKIMSVIPDGAFFLKFKYINEDKRKIIICGPENRLNELEEALKAEDS